MRNKLKIVIILVILMLLPTIIAQEQVTEQQALDSIAKGNLIIEKNKELKFPTTRMEDILIEAQRILKIAKNAEIVRSSEASPQQKRRAIEELKLISWKEITYQDVLDQIILMEEMEEKMLFSNDNIEANLIHLSPGDQDSEVNTLLEQINMAFEEERFEDVDLLTNDLRDLNEQKRAEQSTINTLQKNAKNMFQRYWFFIIASLIIVGLAGFFSQKQVKKKLLKNKLTRMKTEQDVLIDLIKKTQTDRFKHNKISGLVYNIRIKKYQEKLDQIKENLPVIESKLKKRLRKEK